jgi:hypothetical protein
MAKVTEQEKLDVAFNTFGRELVTTLLERAEASDAILSQKGVTRKAEDEEEEPSPEERADNERYSATETQISKAVKRAMTLAMTDIKDALTEYRTRKEADETDVQEQIGVLTKAINAQIAKTDAVLDLLRLGLRSQKEVDEEKAAELEKLRKQQEEIQAKVKELEGDQPAAVAKGGGFRASTAADTVVTTAKSEDGKDQPLSGFVQFATQPARAG